MHRTAKLAIALGAIALVAGVSAARPETTSNGFFAQSATVLGKNVWVVGLAHCSNHSGCTEVMRSTNGGRTFARIGSGPRRWVDDARGDMGPSVFFADARNGYVLAVSDGVWATHDGGTTWSRLPLQNPLAFAVGAGRAYAVTADCPRVVCTNFRLHRTEGSTGQWASTALPLPSDDPIVGLLAAGPDVWIFARSTGHNALARSHDGGRTFTTGPSPCPLGFDGDMSAAPDGSLWVICPNNTVGTAVRSTDGGAQFTPIDLAGLANFTQIGAASASVAVVFGKGPYGPLQRTTDGGRTWQTGWRLPDFSNALAGVAFGDASHGVLLEQTTPDPLFGIERFALWRTADGGVHWSLARFP
jgi:photosystem II stability/assembly factor-like uncharacterized protein